MDLVVVERRHANLRDAVDPAHEEDPEDVPSLRRRPFRELPGEIAFADAEVAIAVGGRCSCEREKQDRRGTERLHGGTCSVTDPELAATTLTCRTTSRLTTNAKRQTAVSGVTGGGGTFQTTAASSRSFEARDS